MQAKWRAMSAEALKGARAEIGLNPLTSDLLPLFEGFDLGLWQSLSPKAQWVCSACYITRCLLLHVDWHWIAWVFFELQLQENVCLSWRTGMLPLIGWEYYLWFSFLPRLSVRLELNTRLSFHNAFHRLGKYTFPPWWLFFFFFFLWKPYH